MQKIILRTLLLLGVLTFSGSYAFAALSVKERTVTSKEGGYTFSASILNDDVSIDRNVLLRIDRSSDGEMMDVIPLGKYTFANGDSPFTFSYNTPAFLETGSYIAHLITRDPVNGETKETGLILGTLNITNEKTESIDIKECFVSVSGKRFGLGQGPDIESGEDAFLECDLASPFTGTVNATMRVFYRSFGGDVIPNTTSELSGVTLSSANKLLKIKLPTSITPQAYTAGITLTTKDGKKLFPELPAHFVIRGVSATLHNLTIEKNDKGQFLTGIVTGPADNFVGAQKQSTLQGADITVTVQPDGSNRTCFSETLPLSTFLKENQGEAPLSFPIKLFSCGEDVIKVTASITLGDKTLSKKEFLFNTAKLSTPIVPTSIAVLAVAILLFAIYSTIHYTEKKKRGTQLNSNVAIIVLLFVSSFITLGTTYHAYALTHSRGPTAYARLTGCIASTQSNINLVNPNTNSWALKTQAECYGSEGLWTEVSEGGASLLHGTWFFWIDQSLYANSTYDDQLKILTLSGESRRQRSCGNSGTENVEAMADIYVNNAIHTKGLYLQNTRDWFQTGIFTDNITRVVSLSGMPSVTKIEIQWDRHASGDARSYNWKDQNAEHIFENLPNPRVQMNIQAN